SWERGRERGLWLRWFWSGLGGFAVGDRRSRFLRLLRSCLHSLSLWLRFRRDLRRWSRVTRLGHVGLNGIRGSDHGRLLAVALESVMHWGGRHAIGTDCHVAGYVIRSLRDIASRSTSGEQHRRQCRCPFKKVHFVCKIVPRAICSII